ncbi:MAG: rod shape-determining protein MreD [Pseudomonadota bacterium]
MNARMPTPEGVIRNEPTASLVLISLALALCVNLLPWQGVPLLVRPDFLLLALIYWCIEEPHRVGATGAFFTGLLMDIAEGSLMGQNALIYSLAAYLVLHFRLRILSFNWVSQALHIFPILCLGQAIFVLEQAILGAALPSPLYFLRTVLGAAVWPILAWVLEFARRRPQKDHLA